ncbi:Metallo-hydrolase/oxidoreductase [Melanomma pulvis-pyrius CBS 109.77]|uniref:Metallo-hydrolase/oxidoreductase n=1 Tax=Melanomma pulvis-pyrius CBS 109.77 TaxID=1314802 RepID=A0A6A6XG85_9PLEO|nr:Metallo-hydrolase/oxidoreductase [Melanomma pulvis-pyrius CBS 109.77]
MPHPPRACLFISRRYWSSSTTTTTATPCSKSFTPRNNTRPRPRPRPCPRSRPHSKWAAPKSGPSATAKMSSAGVGVGAAASAALYAVVSNPAQIGAKPEDAELLAHHLKHGKGYRNPWESFKEFSGPKIMWSMMSRRFSGAANIPDTTPPTVPIVAPTFLPSRTTPTLRATWLGHACFYVEFPGGLRVLFDPVFEDCCAPINLKTLKRFTPPPCEIEDLPVIDVVVISHNHYDHLSYPTTQRIVKKNPDVHFFAPLGNKKWFESCGIKNVTELDWWDTRDVKLELVKSKGGKVDSVAVTPTAEGHTQEHTQGEAEKKITATIGALPCQHVTARGPFDKCKTLWASWSVESGGAKVYFAGDTGYRAVPPLPAGTDDYGPEFAHLPVCPAFAQIGALRGPFDLGLIPIGAYEPRWIMSPMHANPKDSVNIFLETKCKKAIGMHWGTWVLTEEDVMEPPKKLTEALKEKEVEAGRFAVVDIGESREFGAE